MNKTITISILLVLICGLSACATRSKDQVFESTLRAYERVIRWGDITKANQFRKEPVVLSSAQREKFRFIKVTGYNMINVSQLDESTIKIDVAIRYYNEQYAREKTLEDHQQWEYDDKKNLWFISSPLPAF